MVRSILAIFVIALCVFALASAENRNDDISIPSFSFSPEKVAKMKGRERDVYLDEFVKNYNSTQSRLVSLITPDAPKERIFPAVYLLGVFRMEQSAPLLAKYITLKDESHRNINAESAWDKYPVVEALIRIGNPAVPEMIKIINSDENNEHKLNAMIVIRYVEGIDIGKIIVTKSVEKITDEAKRKNLQTLVEKLYPDTADQQATVKK